jgi:hypothetical protein
MGIPYIHHVSLNILNTQDLSINIYSIHPSQVVDLISSQLDCCFAAEKHTYMLAAYASYCMTLDFMDLPALILINVPSIGLTTEKYFSACACDKKNPY